MIHKYWIRTPWITKMCLCSYEDTLHISSLPLSLPLLLPLGPPLNAAVWGVPHDKKTAAPSPPTTPPPAHQPASVHFFPWATRRVSSSTLLQQQAARSAQPTRRNSWHDTTNSSRITRLFCCVAAPAPNYMTRCRRATASDKNARFGEKSDLRFASLCFSVIISIL